MQFTIHKYYKKAHEGLTILVQVDPDTFRGMEIMVGKEGVTKRKMVFDEFIEDDLQHDGFAETGPLEFNLYLKGLVK